MTSASALMSNPSSALQPNPAVGTQAPSSSGSTSSSASNQLGPNSFLKLLTTQLQAQDPLNPLDPSQMVAQLTQINSLQQLMQIRSDLETFLSLAGASAPSGSAQTNPAQPAP